MTRHRRSDANLPREVVAALREGRKVEAIKRLRQFRGVDLNTAREQVDAHLAAHPGAMPKKAAGSFNILPLVAAALIAAAVYYLTGSG